MILLLLQNIDWIDIIQKLGLPVVLVLGLLWFLYQVWKYVTKKVDEKDELIKMQVSNSTEFREKLLISQTDIGRTLETHKTILEDIKDFIIRK